MDNEQTEDLIIEDGMTFVMRAGTATHSIGVDENRAKVLEVSQLWGDTLLDTLHYSQVQPGAIHIGSSIGHRWHFLGVDMGWVPSPLHKVLPYMAPIWSEVDERNKEDFFIDSDLLPGGLSHLLFDTEDGGYVARIPKGWDGFIDQGDARYELHEAVEKGLATREGPLVRVPMIDGIRLAVEIGDVTWFAHLVAAGSKLVNPRSEPVDVPLLGIGSSLLILGALFALVVFFLPSPPEMSLVEVAARAREIHIEVPAEPKQPKPQLADNEAESAGARAPEEAGEVGKRDATDREAQAEKQLQQHRQDVQVATNAGLLGAMRDLGMNSGDFGSAGLSGDLLNSTGGLIGVKGHQIGSAGLAGRGDGLGGGGELDSIGDGLGPNGVGGGRHGYGADHGTSKKGEGAGITTIGDPIVLGALDRSLIDAVVKAQRSRIRYCYQRELAKSPNLGGKITVKFTIAGDGTVSSANLKNSSMKNSGVEQCVVGRFMRMKFPKPRGGGIVIVNYPFIFAPG